MLRNSEFCNSYTSAANYKYQVLKNKLPKTEGDKQVKTADGIKPAAARASQHVRELWPQDIKAQSAIFRFISYS